jgi:hypothetical protein
MAAMKAAANQTLEALEGEVESASGCERIPGGGIQEPVM